MPTASRLRLLLLLAVGLFALVVRFVLLSPDDAVRWIKLLGYWAIAGIVVTAVVVIVRAFQGWKFSWVRHAGPLATAIGCALFLQLHEPRKLRVMYDEYVLVTMSLQMHLERQAWVPGHAQYQDGRLLHVSGFVDKRPLLFTFLLSLIHDVSGYRIANVFVLNGLISLALLWLMFWLCEAIGGRRLGYAGMLLVAGMPLVANVATSGAYDLLNLTLIAALMLVARRYLVDPSSDNQNLLVMTGVLIAQARYESILFLIPMASVVALTWWKTKRIKITWLAIASPLMVLMPMLINLVYLSNDEFFESKRLGVAFFDIANLPRNLEHAVYYFFNFAGEKTNSPLVSFAGTAALLLTAVAFRSVARKGTERPGMAVVYYAFLPVAVANTGMILANFWGLFDDPMASRFSLPLQLFMVLSVIVVCSQLKFRERAAAILVCVTGFSIWAWTVPTNARHEATSELFSMKEVEWQVSQVLKRFDHRTLVIADSALPLVAHRRPAAPFVMFNLKPKVYFELIASGHYEQILVFETLKVDSATGEETVVGMSDPPKNLKLEKVIETRVHKDYISRFSRLVGFKDEDIPKDPTAELPVTEDNAPATP